MAQQEIVKNGRIYLVKELPNGETLMIPVFTKDDVTIGMRRKTRHLKEEDAQEEIFWQLLEKTLTPEEIVVWDDLTAEEFEEAFSSTQDDELKK